MKEDVIEATIAAQVAALPSLPWIELKTRWLKHFGAPPGVNNRRYVIRRLADRLQEDAYRASGHPLVEDNAKRVARLLETGKITRRANAPAPTPGAVLTRLYEGRLHRVTVLADGGFDYEGRRFGSLSKIARDITGTRWSGPAFFGLRSSAKR
ncbi:DUF2924 domain-containing protein [Lysobacter sp. CA199]|uniref:DUF2924 domain-containing protein n=1 Tax=Lysobacter sp. CA199 TaxID=3455608 RepID=UPI003F8D3140